MHVRGTRLLDVFLLISQTCILDHMTSLPSPGGRGLSLRQNLTTLDHSSPFIHRYQRKKTTRLPRAGRKR